MNLALRTLALRLAHPWNIARARGTEVFKVVIVELSEHGVAGIGEAAPISRYGESTDTVAAFCKKIDPQKLSFDDLPAGIAYLEALSSHDHSAKCAVNLALLDGAARSSRKSLHEFLGLDFAEKKHVTSFSIGIDNPAVIRKKVLAAEPFPILKMKVGAAEDRSNLQALREVAPKKPVRVDANEGWPTRDHALKMIETLAADPHIELVEQPMPAATPARDWAWLKERSPLPIFADESYHHAPDAAQTAECFHGVNVKLVKTGGITGALEALRAARRAGLQTMLGCMIESSVLISAAAHLAELADFIDLDGNLLVTNDPFTGVTAEKGILSFATAREPFGLRVSERAGTGSG